MQANNAKTKCSDMTRACVRCLRMSVQNQSVSQSVSPLGFIEEASHLHEKWRRMAEGDTHPLLWAAASSDSESDTEIHAERSENAVANSERDRRVLPVSTSPEDQEEKEKEEEEEAVNGNHFAALWTPATSLPGVGGDDGRSRLWSSAPEINAALRNGVKLKTKQKLATEKQSGIHALLQSQSDTEPDVEALGELGRDRSMLVERQGNGIHETGRNSSVAEEPTALVRPRAITADTGPEALLQNHRRSNERAFDRRSLTSNRPQLERRPSIAAQMSERVAPEWLLLLVGCLLGLSTGISVVIFNKGVTLIHDLAWAGTPHEGAAWLRTQSLAVKWHRILLIPVFGGVVVGMFHSVNAILDMVQCSQPQQSSRGRIDQLAGIRPIIKSVQAATTLGTGCSLGPEGPSVDIGVSWAHGLAEIMNNSRESRIALVAAGAAAGIASGFNAPVAGTFFAIETVLRPQHAENSPPLTTAMIILAAVTSSTVSQALLGEKAAFTVPPYELRSAAELPLYILLGGICGVMSVVFTRLVAWFTRMFNFLETQFTIPHSVSPAVGGLFVGIIALGYPGVLYWGFTNVDEILKTGVTATAPGQLLLAQLTVAKIVATALCKGSGLVGGLYAPSLFIGASCGALYGSIVGNAFNAALAGHNAVAHPQAYALVGMAALLASKCSVPLTSVLLLFELTKDYHILLPLMGAVGLAIWVAEVGNQKKPSTQDSAAGVRNSDGGQPAALPSGRVWRRRGTSGADIELCTMDSNDDPGALLISEDKLMEECLVVQAMARDCVKVHATATVKETLGAVVAARQDCALVVDENGLLEGILTPSDLQGKVLQATEEFVSSEEASNVEVESTLVAAICTGKGENQGIGTNLVVCYPDMNLQMAKDLMVQHGFRQLPVVTRKGTQWQYHKLVGLLDDDGITRCVKQEASKRIAALHAQRAAEDQENRPGFDAH